MVQFAERVNGTWGKEATVKVHCSTKQTCKNFVDPRTGQPLNFNFLPTYATPQLGVLPHTVQVGESRRGEKGRPVVACRHGLTLSVGRGGV